MSFIERWRWRLMVWLWPKKYRGVGHSNRLWWVAMMGPIEVKLTYRDTRQEDGYSREELIEMLRVIRESERHMGWKVPQ